MENSSPPSLAELIQYRRVFPADVVSGLLSQCQCDEWSKSENLDRFSIQLAPSTGGYGQTVVDTYLGDLPDLYRRMLVKGFESNNGWSGQVKLAKYVAPSNGFPYHADQWQKWPGRDWKRVLTSLTYLNDDYEGGITRFAHGLEIVPEQGKTLTFPTSWAFSHQGDPVTRGTKHLLVVHIWS